MASGDQNLRAFGCAADAHQIYFGALSFPVALVRSLFFERKHCLGAPKIQRDGSARFGLLNHAGYYVSLMLLELLVEEVTLSFAQALQHDLLGRLCRDSAGVVG